MTDVIDHVSLDGTVKYFQDTDGKQGIATIESTSTASKAYAVGDYLWYNGKLYIVTSAIASSGTITVGTNVSEVTVGGQLGSLTSRIAYLESVGIHQSLIPYLYKTNAFVNSSNKIATLNGYNLYRIPFSFMDLMFMTWDANSLPWGTGFNINSYAVAWENSSGTISRSYEAAKIVKNASYNFGCVGMTGIAYLYVCVQASSASKIKVQLQTKKNTMNTDDYYYTSVTKLTNDNCITTPICVGNSDTLSIADATNYKTRWLHVRQGDVLKFNDTNVGTNYLGKFFNTSYTRTTIANGTERFVCPADGIVNMYEKINDANITIYPKNSIQIESKNVAWLSDYKYNGLSGVAFGTSLTYRAATTYGYLQYLPTLSGMTFDNQGIGSSYIYGNMLTAIKGYSDYSDKDVCIIEGFCNDWYYAKTLGSYTDTTETSVCGCVRSAINYVLSQNANITVFLVLDHYGQLDDSVDNRSIATNSNSQTQYAYYEEIAKVAESMGIPVIKLYAYSQISENAPQYLADNIHPTALGAEQTANVIWSKMRGFFPNVTA